MKGIFIPEITVEMFRNGCLESIETLMTEGEIYDIEYDPKSEESDVPDINVGDINKFIDGLEEIFADLRERHGDDSVCGLCEYDGAYIGQSGECCNECPGFEKDDCFKLSGKVRKDWTDEIIKALPSAEPEIIRCKDCKHWYSDSDTGMSCEFTNMFQPEDGFCNWAERR